MSTRNRTLGGLGMAVAAIVALSVTACDPYIQANKAAPVVIGVSMTDTSYNEIIQPDSTDCQAPYPQIDKTWADQAFPGLCNPDNVAFGIPSVCPVLCYPPRVGPGYAPLYTGNLGGSYQTVLPGTLGTYTYTALPAYVLGAVTPVPPIYVDAGGDEFTYGTIRILFNKLLQPTSVQPNPLSCDEHATGPDAIKVTLNGVDVTSTHPVCYVPNSDTEYWGGSITVTSPKVTNIGTTANPVLVPVLEDNSTYHITGQVQDQQGNAVSVDVTVISGVELDDAPTSLTYPTSTATFTVGTAITPLEPTTTGGEVSAFTVTPALPAGLTISRSTGIISGTPTAATATATYVVKAANGAGSVTFPISITVDGAPALR